MADSDSIEQDSTPTPFISRMLIGRFLAVGLFVALGTFAVIQSISGSKEDPHAGHDHEAVAELEVEPQEKQAVFSTSVKPVASTHSRSLADNPSSNKPSINKPSVSFGGSSKVIKPSVVVTPAQPAFSATANGSSSSSPNKLTRPTSGFSIGNQPKSPTVSTASKPSTLRPSSSQGGFGVVQQGSDASAKTAAAKPPERLAQAGSGGFAPEIGSAGFGATTSSRRSPTTFGDSVNSGAKSAAQSAAQATRKSFGDLRSSVNAGAGALLAATKQTVEDTADAGANVAADLTNKASTAISNPFGRPAATTQPAGQLPKPTLAQPTTSTSAVLRPVQSAADNSGNTGSLRSFADRRSPANASSSASAEDSPTKSPFSNSRRSNAQNPFGNASTKGNASAMGTASAGVNTSATTAKPQRTRSTTLTPPTRPAIESRGSSSPALAMQRNASAGGSPSTQLNARLASSVSTRALNTPGDRRLEGVQAPALTIEKVSPREIQVNQSADFEIKVRNVGRVVANDVMVVDRVPSGTEFIGASPEPTKLDRSGDVQWSIGTIEPGQEKRIRFQLRPTQPGEIGSVAHVLFATQASMRTVVTKPVLDIVHSARPRVLIGDNVIFDVIVENKGDGPATDVFIQEEVPEQLEYQEGFRQLEYPVGTLMPGQKRKIQLALRAEKVGEFRNVVFVTGKGGLEAKHEIDVEVIAPEIRVTSAGPSRRFLQRQATHRFTIENRGTAEANNVNLMARLPGGLRYVSSDNRGRYDSNSHAVYWKMPSLKDGVAGTVELTTVPVEVGQQNIKFEANADLRLTAQTTQEMAVEHLVDVYFEIDDVVDPIEVGTDTTYRLRILNQGTKVASNVQLQVEFPRGLEPTSVDGDLRHQIQGQQVAFEPISSLPPGQEVQLSIRARGNAPGDHRVIASIRSDGREVEVSKEDTTRVYSDR